MGNLSDGSHTTKQIASGKNNRMKLGVRWKSRNSCDRK